MRSTRCVHSRSCSFCRAVAGGPGAGAAAAANHCVRRASRRCGAEVCRDGGAVRRGRRQGEARRADQRRRRPFLAGRRAARAAPQGGSRGVPREARRRDRRARHPRRRADAGSRDAEEGRQPDSRLAGRHRPLPSALGLPSRTTARSASSPKMRRSSSRRRFSRRTRRRRKGNPIFLFYSDDFKKPYPFDPILAVGFDEVAQKKWDCISDAAVTVRRRRLVAGALRPQRPDRRSGAQGVPDRSREAAERRRREPVPRPAGASSMASRRGARSSTPKRSS